jgi:hypothetical protein
MAPLGVVEQHVDGERKRRAAVAATASVCVIAQITSPLILASIIEQR